MQQPFDNLGRELHLPGGGGLDRPAQVVGLGILQQIADGPGADGADDFFIFQDAGQGHDLDLRQLATDEGRGGDAVHDRHEQVHEHDVGPQGVGQLHGLGAIRRLPDDLQVRV